MARTAAAALSPVLSAVAAGCVMSVMLGVILAHTGTCDAPLIQVHTSDSSSQSWPMAMPMRRSGMPCGQLKLISNASTPTSSHLPMISSQALLHRAGRQGSGVRRSLGHRDHT